jgi:aspartyl-tRNA(Asn)/glutamyl-tRNA(Gln) amidotransferase subunit B
MIQLIDNNTISGKMAKSVFQEMWKSGKAPGDLVKDLGMSQITDEAAIGKIVDEVMAANTGQVEQYRSGKTKLFGFFVGQAMKASKGQANPEILNQVLQKKLQG